MKHLLPLLLLAALNAGASTLTNGLIEYWRLDESSGTRSGVLGVENLTPTNGVASASGIITNAISLNGSNQYVIGTTNGALAFSGSFSWSVWANPSALSGQQILVSKWSSTGEYDLFYDNNVHQWLFYISDSGNVSHHVGVSATPTLGNWYHITAWFDAPGQTVNLAIEGVGTNSVSTGAVTVGDKAQLFWIGAEQNSLFWNGLIDEVGVWNRVLTDDERLSLYCSARSYPWPSKTFTPVTAAFSDVAAAVTNSISGDTINVPSGTVNWSGQTINLLSRGVYFGGAGAGLTTISNTDTYLESFSLGSNLLRITGFTFQGSNSIASLRIQGPATNVRVDHCNFNLGNTALACNFDQAPGPVYGCVDHCAFTNFTRAFYAFDARIGDVSGSPVFPSGGSNMVAWNEWNTNAASFPGSIKMMYFENNYFYWDTNFPGNAQGALYGSDSGKACFRYNTFTNWCQFADAHGPANGGGGTIFYDIGPSNLIYTSVALCTQSEAFWQRGGTALVHDNVMIGPEALHSMSVYLTNDNSSMRVTNTYIWGNTLNGDGNQTNLTQIRDSGQTPAGYSAANIVLNTNYFLHAPQAGQVFYPYVPLIYPHPLDTIAVTNQPPATPVNVTPSNLAANVAVMPLLTASVYSDPNPSAQINSDWQVYKGASLVWENANGGASTSAQVTTLLAWSTPYTWTVRYENALGLWSSFSTPTTFTTTNAPTPPTPSSNTVAIITGGAAIIQ